MSSRKSTATPDMPRIKKQLLAVLADKENVKLSTKKQKVLENITTKPVPVQRHPLKGLSQNVTEIKTVKYKIKTTYKTQTEHSAEAGKFLGRFRVPIPIKTNASLSRTRSKSTTTQSDRIVEVIKTERPKSTSICDVEQQVSEDELTEVAGRTSTASSIYYSLGSGSSLLEDVTQEIDDQGPNKAENDDATDATTQTHDDVFVDAVEFFRNYPPKRKSTVKMNVSVPRLFPVVSDCVLEGLFSNNSQTGAVRRSARKTTLTGKSSKIFRRRVSLEVIYDQPVIDSEYYEDIVKYMMSVEATWVIRKDQLAKTLKNSKQRLSTVNWMVYLQQYFKLQDSTLYSAVRLLDRTLASIDLNPESFSLAGLVCIWMIAKVFDSEPISVSKIFAMAGGKYTRHQILILERDILGVIEFDLHRLADQETFIFYYMDFIKMQSNKLVRCGSLFILECFMLSLDFSSIPPSLLAACALYLAMATLQFDHSSFMDLVEKTLLGREEFLRFVRRMAHFVDKLLSLDGTLCPEILTKYSSEDGCVPAVQANITRVFNK